MMYPSPLMQPHIEAHRIFPKHLRAKPIRETMRLEHSDCFILPFFPKAVCWHIGAFDKLTLLIEATFSEQEMEMGLKFHIFPERMKHNNSTNLKRLLCELGIVILQGKNGSIHVCLHVLPVPKERPKSVRNAHHKVPMWHFEHGLAKAM